MKRKSSLVHLRSLFLKTMLIAINAGLLTTAISLGSARAEDYPNRPITVIAPYSAGGDSDLAARNFGAAAQPLLGQPVVVINKTGGSGVVGSAYVIASPADGYTLLLGRTGSQVILPALQPSTTRYGWDQYTFISTLELNPYGCLVNAASKYRTFKDLTDAIRTKGTALNYGTAGVLTTNDMGPRLLFNLLKVASQAPTEIPYRGTGETAQSLLAGQTDFSCGALGSFLGLVQSGSLRVLLVTTKERFVSMPDVPTARELGYSDMEGIIGWSAILGPPNLPTAVRDKLASTVKIVSTDPAWLKGTAQTGSVAYILSPEETKNFMHKQYQLYRSLGDSLGIINAKP
jgi:tripartite-type tricarboxylate transporter receptor subunit TctC